MKVTPSGTPDAELGAPPVAPPVPNPRTERILHGPILSTLLRLAAPNIVVVVAQALSSAIDAFYLGRLGAPVLAGIALVFPLWTLMVTTSAGALGGGISSSVARALGAGRRLDANAVVAHALILSTLAAFAFSIVVLVGGPLLFPAMGGSGPALEAALAYSTIIFAGAVFVWWVNAFGSLLRGAGEMLFPAIVVVSGELLHIVLAPVLIFSLDLGVRGAALSLVTSYVVRALVLAWYVVRGRATIRMSSQPLGLRFRLFWDILRIGLPASINSLLSNLNVIAVTTLVGTTGMVSLAGYGLAARLQFLLIPLVFGFGTALVTMVGTNVGAGRLQRARRVTWIGAGVAAVATGSVGVVVALVPTAWLGLFTAEASVLAVGSSYLRIVAPTFALFGLGLALYFAAQGAGRVLPALLAGVCAFTISVGGGWLEIHVLHADLPWLFATIAVGLVVFGCVQALAVNSLMVSRNPAGRDRY